MKLHENKNLFLDAIIATSQKLDIEPIYVEKDYWISRSLKLLANADKDKRAIFKGGTSLSKVHKIGYRFSEDIDVAILNPDSLNGNQRKMLIKRLAKAMSQGLTEIKDSGVTSKGSSYYKALFQYESKEGLVHQNNESPIRLGQMLIEINSFANPYPFRECIIDNFIGNFMQENGHHDLVEQYELAPFSLRVLDKRTTLTEKIISLIRFSFSENLQEDLAKKIRHFYDLYFLMQDKECQDYISSPTFSKDLQSLLSQDRERFSNPSNWNRKVLTDSPLFTSLNLLWRNGLGKVYQREIAALAYRAIPESERVLENALLILERIRSTGIQ